MKFTIRTLFGISCLLVVPTTGGAQSIKTTNEPANHKEPDGKPTKAGDSNAEKNKEKAAELERIRRERRANAQSLLISLAADAGKFNDQTQRARTQARIADALWDVDNERSRELFRKAWEAAEVADKNALEQSLQQAGQQKTGTGSVDVNLPQNSRAEVLRLAARRDRSLGEEFLAKLKMETQQDVTDAAGRSRSNPFDAPEALSQRLSLAGQLLDSDVRRAVQFADPALHVISKEGLNFLSYLRDKDPGAADRYYAALLTIAAGSLQSDANTVSLLSSYLFTPHLFVTFSGPGGTYTDQMSPNIVPPNVAPELRSAFFGAAAQILLRPQPPPEQDQGTSGPEGKYFVIKRLLPLFEQYAPREMTEALNAQLDALATGLPDTLRQRDDDSIRQRIRSPQKDEDREQALLDQADHAKTAAERDRLFLQLSRIAAEAGNAVRAHEWVEKIDDGALRQQTRAFVDATLVIRAINKKQAEEVLELVRTGELTHLQKSWALSQAAKLINRNDHDSALAILDEAAAEARRVDTSNPDRPRALIGVANAFLVVDRSRTWDAVHDAATAANSADGFTGEDGVLSTSLFTKGMSFSRSSSTPDFDVAPIYGELARDDYGRAVELARLLQGEASRANAVIAIARAVLEEKTK
jgi:hypothetical protein